MIDATKYRRALSLFRLGTNLLGKLPRQGDGPLDLLVKLLAIADSVDKTYGGKSTVYENIFSKYDLRERNNGPFVRLFFGTNMSSSFEIHRHGISEHFELIEAVDQRGERLFFQEYRYNRPEVSDEFFYTPGFDFGAAVHALWARYPTGMYLSIKPPRGGWGSQDVTFCAVPPPRGDIISSAALERIECDVEAHRSRAGEPWALIAYGPPGTGKSSYAVAMARATGGRLLKMDASSLPLLGVQDIGFLLDVLRPTFLLIDDFDRAPVEETRARVLFLFEHLHNAHAGVTVAVTVNDVGALDAALLRSERIDEAKEFTLPDDAERRDVLERLLLKRPDEDLVTATEGFNHADLAGLVRRLRREGQESALAAMRKLRDLAEKANKKNTPPGGPGKEVKDPSQTKAPT